MEVFPLNLELGRLGSFLVVQDLVARGNLQNLSQFPAFGALWMQSNTYWLTSKKLSGESHFCWQSCTSPIGCPAWEESELNRGFPDQPNAPAILTWAFCTCHQRCSHQALCIKLWHGMKCLQFFSSTGWKSLLSQLKCSCSQSGDEPPSKIICSLRGPLDLALELHFVSISFASMSKLEMANLDMTAEESESSPKAALPRSRAWWGQALQVLCHSHSFPYFGKMSVQFIK